MVNGRHSYNGIVVTVSGPPHSGKSVFLAELYRALLRVRPSEIFLQRACPDGEGMWSAESDPNVVKAIRRKWTYSPEFKDHVLSCIKPLGEKFSILLLDMGGFRDDFTGKVLSLSTYFIVLSEARDELQAWTEFGSSQGAVPIALLDSRIVRRADHTLDISVRSALDLSVFPVTGVLYNLDREGPPDPYREALRSFARWLFRFQERR